MPCARHGDMEGDTRKKIPVMIITVMTAIGAALVIVFSGIKLSKYGDRIAELTGLGGLWVGVVFMATATSLPEIFTTVSAALLQVPDFVTGDLLGAGLTNMFTLGLIDQLYRQKKVWRHVAVGHSMMAALAITLVGLMGFFILLKFPMVIGTVGVDSCLLLLLYILGMRIVYRQDHVTRLDNQNREVANPYELESTPQSKANGALRNSIIGFSISALGILIAAPLLASSAQQITVQTGISTSFIGTSLLAVTTSLPELVIAVSAVRMGHFDLAVGNLFGSNAFNIGAIFFADLAYTPGPILSSVNSLHAMTAFWSILLMNIGLMGILYQAERRFFMIEPDSLVIMGGYVLGMWLLFH